MSFGFSIGDLATLVALTKKTYDGWRDAPREYQDVVQTLSESNILLCHVERRFDTLTGTETNDGKQKEIGDLLRGCQSIISDLRSVVKRRRKLGHWDRIRLGASHVNDCKNRLARHLNILTPFLFSLELESIGKDIGSLPATLDRLPQMLSNALPAALGKMIDQRIEDSRTARGSIMSTYGDDDDKQAYRELRRNLRSFGIKDSVVRQQRSKLVEFIRTLTHDDHNTVTDDAHGNHQIPVKQPVPGPSPELIPQVLRDADDIETICAKNVRMASARRYQAYVETEDEDDSMESVSRLSTNDKAAPSPEKAETSMDDDGELRTHIGSNGEDRTGNEPEATKSADATLSCGESTTGVERRRKYQAYVETEDEDDVPKTSRTTLDDLSVRSGLPQKTSNPVPPQAFGVSEPSNIKTKAGRASRKTCGPVVRLIAEPPTASASCGEPECRKHSIIHPLVFSDGTPSWFEQVLCDCYCSMSDHESDSEGEDSCSGDDNEEEGRSKGYDGEPSASPPADPEQKGQTPRSNPREQRLIEYAPLDVNKEGLLTIELHMPAGHSIHIEGGRFAMFHDQSAHTTSRRYFRSLPRIDYHVRPNNNHGFPSGPRCDRWCCVSGCQAVYWTPELQYWNPGFLDGLRSWVRY